MTAISDFEYTNLFVKFSIISYLPSWLTFSSGPPRGQTINPALSFGSADDAENSVLFFPLSAFSGRFCGPQSPSFDEFDESSRLIPAKSMGGPSTDDWLRKRTAEEEDDPPFSLSDDVLCKIVDA